MTPEELARREARAKAAVSSIHAGRLRKPSWFERQPTDRLPAIEDAAKPSPGTARG
jgi:hypothetical protein